MEVRVQPIVSTGTKPFEDIAVRESTKLQSMNLTLD